MNKLQVAQQQIDTLKVQVQVIGARRNELHRESFDLQARIDALSTDAGASVDELAATIARKTAGDAVKRACDAEIAAIEKQMEGWRDSVNDIMALAANARHVIREHEQAFAALVAARDEAQRMLDVAGANVQMMAANAREGLAALVGE